MFKISITDKITTFIVMILLIVLYLDYTERISTLTFIIFFIPLSVTMLIVGIRELYITIRDKDRLYAEIKENVRKLKSRVAKKRNKIIPHPPA